MAPLWQHSEEMYIMKKLLIFTMLLSCFLMTYKGNAQLRVGVRANVNIGLQPIWGPVGYSHVDYYYLPGIDVYYNVPQHQYVYFENNQWINSPSLPPRYGNYDMYRGYKVVINEPTPYLHADVYRARYSRYRNYSERQHVIRDSRDRRYYEIPDHPMHSHWKEQGDNDHHDNGHHGERH